MYPHSLPFRQPVDPVLEQIPVTYFMRFVVNAVSFAKVYAFLAEFVEPCCNSSFGSGHSSRRRSLNTSVSNGNMYSDSYDC